MCVPFWQGLWIPFPPKHSNKEKYRNEMQLEALRPSSLTWGKMGLGLKAAKEKTVMNSMMFAPWLLLEKELGSSEEKGEKGISENQALRNGS